MTAGHAYAITAQASDGTLTSSQAVTIATVTDVATPSTTVDGNATANSVAEGAANGNHGGRHGLRPAIINGPRLGDLFRCRATRPGGGFTIGLFHYPAW